MNDNMTIFDFIEADVPDFRGLTEREVVDYIGGALGVTFEYNKAFEEYEVKFKNSSISCHLSSYLTLDENNGKPFISVSFEDNKNHAGCGMPCDSIEEAIEFFRKYRAEKGSRI